MKLKDIALWTTNGGVTNSRYNINWVIGGNMYMLQEVSCYTDSLDSFYKTPTRLTTRSMVHLGAVDINTTPAGLDLSLDNDILIGYDYILVQSNTDLHDESTISHKQNFFLYKDDFTPTMIGDMRWFTIALFNTKERRFEHNLRNTFDYLINPPISSEPVELTLDEKLDDLIEVIMRDSRTMAVKKLKRMLNERL